MKTITASTLLLGPLIFAASTLAVPQNLAALNIPALGGVASSSSTSMRPKSTHYNEKPMPSRTETSTKVVYESATPTYQAQAQAAAPTETQWMQQSGASSAAMPPIYQVVNASTSTMSMGNNMTGMSNMTDARNGAATLAWNNKASLLSGAAVAGGFLFLV